MVILTEVEDINRFPNAERFASFIGLIPMTKSSGEKEKVGERTFRSHDCRKCLGRHPTFPEVTVEHQLRHIVR